MAEEDWAAAFRPTPPQLPQQPPELPQQPPQPVEQQQQQQVVTPSQVDPNLIDTILGSVAEMFMLLEQRTRESLISIIESQEQQGLLIARKFEELEQLISNDGDLPITNIHALDPELAEQIRMNDTDGFGLTPMEAAQQQPEPDFMPALDNEGDGDFITGELPEEVEALQEVADELVEENPELFGLEPSDDEPLNSEIVPEDIKTAYWEWKDGNGTFQDFVKAAGGPKGAKKYREIIEQ